MPLALQARSRPGRATPAPDRAPPAVPAARNDPWRDGFRRGRICRSRSGPSRSGSEHEARLQLLFVVVHLGADQEQRGLGIDQQLDAVRSRPPRPSAAARRRTRACSSCPEQPLVRTPMRMPAVGLPRPSISALTRSAARRRHRSSACGRGRRAARRWQRGCRAARSVAVVLSRAHDACSTLYSAASLVSSFLAVLAR